MLQATTTQNNPLLTELAETSLEALVGNTPLLQLQRITRHLPAAVRIFAKLEWHNPSGSIKDRAALFVLRAALQAGELGRGRVLLDSTSGNMGIAYATLAAARGIAVKLCVPENVSRERITVLRSLGASLVLTDAAEGSDGAILKARELAAAEPERYFYADQYNNSASWHAHYHTTGQEIISQSAGQITHLVVGLGTAGTMVGTGRYLKQYSSEIALVAVQPDAAFHGIEGWKHMASSIQPGIYDAALPDIQAAVRTEDALLATRRLAKEEGLFVGISAGAATVAALQLAATMQAGYIVVIFPDSGYKYLSDQMWQP
jgi:cysteine synthase B